MNEVQYRSYEMAKDSLLKAINAHHRARQEWVTLHAMRKALDFQGLKQCAHKDVSRAAEEVERLTLLLEG